MKRSFTTHELEMRSAKEHMHTDSNLGMFIGSPALNTIKRHLREGNLSRLTTAMILLLLFAAFAFCVYFVTSDSEAVRQAKMLIESQKASSPRL